MAKKSHGFSVVSKELDYENPFMRVYRQQVIRPDGKEKPYWVLDRLGDFSVIIPIFPDNSTILVGQYRVPTKRYLWEFPMGMVFGASPIATAKKELRQETGLRAKNWKKLGYFYVGPGFSGQRSHIFTATDLTEGESEPEEDEYIKTQRISMENVRKMIQRGEISDGPTIVALHFLEQGSDFVL